MLTEQIVSAPRDDIIRRIMDHIADALANAKLQVHFTDYSEVAIVNDESGSPQKKKVGGVTLVIEIDDGDPEVLVQYNPVGCCGQATHSGI